MYDFRLVSSLTKVFPNVDPAPLNHAPEGLIGEEVSLQAAFRARDEGFARAYAEIELESPVKEYIRMYRVRYVPVTFACPPDADDDYLSKKPGLYPDLLEPAENCCLRIYSGHWESVFLAIAPPDSLPAGEYPLRVTLKGEKGEVLASACTVYKRINARLPRQKLVHTRWFHTDGLCQYYNVEIWSEEFWRICENFVREAAAMGINCLLTPVHTPPLDTREGGERLTGQLVDITLRNGRYSFGFKKLRRWIKMAQECGIEYFEIAHLFTQWGAKHAPKIMATVDGEYRRIFCWETDAVGPEYTGFLKKYIPALRKELSNLGILDKCYFHISDEPRESNLEFYRAAADSVKKELEGLKVIDALSNIEFYRQGLVKMPVPASDHIKPFLAENVPNLWTYYCCGQYKEVSNVFMAMPASRSRMIGVQLYKFRIAGLLQWGYNFYNNQYSDDPVNPFLSTDGDGFTPAGDCFIVYPGANGQAWPSLRSEAVKQAMYDLRALELLETYIGRDEVVRLIEEGIAPIEFDVYPRSADWLPRLRAKVNALLAEYAK
ncbi:MAG: DUF4091 domain-containing protein [Clostridiales bacterium]|nr:DUF4091 domain-containing protein [Clostridiales bacterium]